MTTRRYADALRRIEIDGIAVKDFAAEGGLSQNDAAVRAFRAREALRRQAAASCGTCAEHGIAAPEAWLTDPTFLSEACNAPGPSPSAE